MCAKNYKQDRPRKLPNAHSFMKYVSVLLIMDDELPISLPSRIPPLPTISLKRSRFRPTLQNLGVVVVDEAELGTLAALGDDNVAAVAALAIDQLETPDLGGRPAGIQALDVAEDELAVSLGLPAVLQVGVLDLVQAEPCAAALDVAKQPVGVVAVGVVQAPVLLGVGEARGGLVDVDVDDGVGGLVRGLGRSLVLVHTEANGSIANPRADKVADALDGQGWIGRLGQLLVLEFVPPPAAARS